MRSPKNNVLWFVLSIALTFITFAAFAAFADISRILSLLRQSHPHEIFLGFILFAVANIIKAARLRWVTSVGTPDIVTMLGIVFVYNLLTTILPAGIGEAYYPLLLRSRQRGGLSVGVSAVLLSRIFDVLCVCIAATIAFLLVAPQHLRIYTWVLIGIALGVCGGIAAVLLLGRSVAFRRYLHWQAVAMPLLRQPTVFIERVQCTLAEVASWKRVGMIALLSIFIWITTYVACWMITQGFYLTLTLATVVLCISLSLLVSAMPIKGLLGLGTQQVGWVFTLTMIGWSAQAALDVALSSYLILLVYTFVLGVGGQILLLVSSRSDVDEIRRML